MSICTPTHSGGGDRIDHNKKARREGEAGRKRTGNIFSFFALHEGVFLLIFFLLLSLGHRGSLSHFLFLLSIASVSPPIIPLPYLALFMSLFLTPPLLPLSYFLWTDSILFLPADQLIEAKCSKECQWEERHPQPHCLLSIWIRSLPPSR